MTRKITAAACAAAMLLVPVSPAMAHVCAVAKKPATAGAVGIDGPDGFVPLKPNPGTPDKPHGGFVAFTDGENEASTFLHAPGGDIPAVREGGPQYDCDGKGLENLEVCFGGQ